MNISSKNLRKMFSRYWGAHICRRVFQSQSLSEPETWANSMSNQTMKTLLKWQLHWVLSLVLGALLWATWVPAFGQELLFTLDDPNPQTGAQFGVSVAGVGNLNGDSVPDIAVGAEFQDVTEAGEIIIDQGQAFAFSGADGSLLRTWFGISQAGARFGASVAGWGMSSLATQCRKSPWARVLRIWALTLTRVRPSSFPGRILMAFRC